MNFPKITFKIEDRIYRVDATDGPTIKKIPKHDREHLLTLFAAIKKQHDSDIPNSVATTIPSESKETVASKVIAPQVIDSVKNPNKTDIEQLMLRLAAEEKSKQKPFNKNKAYLYLGGGTVFILGLLFLMI